MNHLEVRRFILSLFLVLIFAAGNATTFAQETEKTNSTEVTDAQSLLRSNLLVQEQLHTALRAIEQARQDADAAAKKSAEIFNERISAMEKSLAEQRRNDLEVLRASSRSIFTAASILAAIGVFALLCTAYFQVRAMNRVAEFSKLITTIAPLDPTRALGAGDPAAIARIGSADQSNARLTVAIEELEKKIHQLDSANLHSSFQPNASKLNSPETAEHYSNGANGAKHSETESRVNLLLTEGQALLDEGDAENALVYFEQALDLEPNNTEALIKKGTTLEALRKMQEALATYDQAIAKDSSMTVAYLYKGGVLNRLQRFTEAMECYEQALKTQAKSAA